MPQIDLADIHDFLGTHWLILLYDVEENTWLYRDGRLYVFAADMARASGEDDWWRDCRYRQFGTERRDACAVYEVEKRERELVAVWVHGVDVPDELRETRLPSASGPLETGTDDGSGGPSVSASQVPRPGINLAEVKNFLVRLILDIGLSPEDWQRTLKHFNYACACCGREPEKQKDADHAIPINKEQLGEHRAGNVVPCCRDCNQKKHAKDYVQFLSGKERGADRIRRIEELMQECGYRPIREHHLARSVRDLLDSVRSGTEARVLRAKSILASLVGR